MPLSVIICSHNPRPDYLRRVLDALKAQTLSKEQWELLLIDNASKEPLAEKYDLSWHPHARHIREEELGLTPARLRGIKESAGELLVFVDDDNVPDKNYLMVATKIAREYEKLGAWSGQALAEFEVAPPEKLRPFLHFLCIRELDRDIWGNLPDHLPHGAGMCVRRQVASRYWNDTANNSQRLWLDRAGDFLGGAGDLDLAMTSFDLGLGTGLFCALVLKHLIPERRLKESYMFKLLEDGAASGVVLESIRPRQNATTISRIDHWVARYKYWRAGSMQKKAADASRRGEIAGRKILADLRRSETRS